jgi:hypothetical protein
MIIRVFRPTIHPGKEREFEASSGNVGHDLRLEHDRSGGHQLPSENPSMRTVPAAAARACLVPSE